MILDKQFAQKFTRRERRQGQHLRRALLGRHQKIFLSPKKDRRRLSKANRFALLACNGYGRAHWFRLLAGHIARCVGAKPPHYIASSPIYLLTIIDKRQLQTSIKWHRRRSAEEFVECRRMYASLMVGFHGVGMIDVAPYVYVGNIFNGHFVFAYHVHAIVWGMTKVEIERRCAVVRRQVKSLLPISTAVRCVRFRPEDFLQLCWYVGKMPRRQYQLHCRGGRSGWRQFKAPINGVNSVRSYSNQWGHTLDELTIAWGLGRPVLENVLRDVRRWRRRAGWRPELHAPAPIYYPPPPGPPTFTFDELRAMSKRKRKKKAKKVGKRRLSHSPS